MARIEQYKAVEGSLVPADRGAGEGFQVNWGDTNVTIAKLFRVDVKEVARIRPVEHGIDVEDFSGRVTLAGRVVPEVKADAPVKAKPEAKRPVNSKASAE